MTISKLLTITALMSAASLVAQTSDVTPPSLIEFDFNPKAIDVTVRAQNVTATLQVTDDLSGVNYMYVYFQSPSGQYQDQYLSSFDRIAGTQFDGAYQADVEIPQFSEAGTWQAYVYVYDAVGNYSYISTSALADGGFATDLTVTSTPDTTAPTVAGLTITPSSIDVSSGDQVLTIDLHLTDDLSGVDIDQAYVYLQSEANQQRQQSSGYYFTLIGGADLDGMWQASMTIPQYSEDGVWNLDLWLVDKAANRTYLDYTTLAGMGFTPSFTVTAAPEDTTAPQLSNLTFTPSVIDTSAGAQYVDVSLDLTDDQAGVDFWADYGDSYYHGVQFRSPSAGQNHGACCTAWSLTSGTVLNGTWQATIYFPQYSEAGTWKARLIQVSDRVHNWFNMEADQIEAAGFSADLVIVRPSLEGDGTVDTGGGTVEDETFGSQATVTFPPNAVDGETDVAIDVFESPIDVDTPQGFQGIGTNFVNISLTPEPTYPFPSPGVTLVLPLSGPELLPVGFAIPLYYVETVSGTLQPMLDTAGFPVIGYVDPGQLTATFAGISHFTIVVGLVPDVISVSIDIHPSESNDVNAVNSSSKGKIPVAILSTESFLATTEIDQTTITFGKTGDEASLSKCNGNGEDVNSDGILDLVCHFSTRLTGFAAGDTAACSRARLGQA